MTADRGRAIGLLADVRGDAGSNDGEARFRAVARLAPVGIVVFDADGQCTFASDRWCEWTGISRADALGSGWTEALHPDDIDRVESEGARAIAAGAELRIECRLLAGGDRWRWIDAVVVPMTGNGEITGYLGALTDVSERKKQAAERELLLSSERAARQQAERVRRELVARIEQLREIDESKTQFTAVASHDLRTPLASIVSFADLILDLEPSLSEDTIEFLHIIGRSAEQVLRLVGDLMLLTGLETGITALRLGDVKVPELISDAVATGSVAASRRAVSLDGSAQHGPPARGDRIRLRQVVDNLIGNAVKFSRDGDHVTVRATHDDQFWRIDVQDQGIGIPAAEVDRLFLRFFRASNAMNGAIAGTGIGLSIVKTITELHGGTIEVQTTEGEGSTFSVLIPVRT